jgi:hypothetical protein
MPAELLNIQTAVASNERPSSIQPIWIEGILMSIEESGKLRVDTCELGIQICEWLQSETNSKIMLQAGDRLLITFFQVSQICVAIGRIGAYERPTEIQKSAKNISIEASDSLAFKCGLSTIELHADGKLLVKGEDVLMRASGTHKIRAGTVSIN